MTAIAFTWFGALVIFILAVMFKRWREHEKRDAARTKKVMGRLGYDTSGTHIWDA